jgi:hypothetical protein
MTQRPASVIGVLAYAEWPAGSFLDAITMDMCPPSSSGSWCINWHPGHQLHSPLAIGQPPSLTLLALTLSLLVRGDGLVVLDLSLFAPEPGVHGEAKILGQRERLPRALEAFIFRLWARGVIWRSPSWRCDVGA